MQKLKDKPDGCLALVNKDFRIEEYQGRPYADGSGHIYQSLIIENTRFINTHIKWAPIEDPNHIGKRQLKELIHHIGNDSPAIIAGDINDRPGGPVREVLNENGFYESNPDYATAIINGLPVSIVVIAAKGISIISNNYHKMRLNIPSTDCPSDHIPIFAETT